MLKSISILRCARRTFSSSAASELVLVSTLNGVRTIKMNNPKKLNGWTQLMMETLFGEIKRAGTDNECKVLIITSVDPYYSAGVDLGGTLSIMHPKVLQQKLISHNIDVFNTFLDFPKPIIAAINGPAIGATVTSATLCDAIIASEKATFLTPFARLGVPPEGCSSVHFEYLMGPEAANKMLKENWLVNAGDAKKIKLVTEVVPHAELQSQAQALAETWIAEGKHLQSRKAMGYGDFARLKEVNIQESIELGHAFLSSKFINAQYDFLSSKGKTAPAVMFKLLSLTRPLWIRLL